MDISRIIFPEPFQEHLLGISHLSIASIEDISTVPINLLRPFHDERLVVEQFSVSFLNSASDIENGTQANRHKFFSPLIVGNPRAPKDPEWVFPDLPGAQREAVQIGKIFNATVLIGAAASKQAIWKAIRNEEHSLDLIYFAAHGISLPDQALDNSFVVLAEDTHKRAAPKDRKAAPWRLTAREVQGLQLMGAPLVVLSACQSGLGDIRRGGVIGIARAFQKAGAGSTIMSLWSVNDAATSYLMLKFARTTAKHSVPESLRLAMLEARKKYPQPRDWAGFNIFGNGPSTR
jgi:CHAT domain-containing protein